MFDLLNHYVWFIESLCALEGFNLLPINECKKTTQFIHHFFILFICLVGSLWMFAINFSDAQNGKEQILEQSLCQHSPSAFNRSLEPSGEKISSYMRVILLFHQFQSFGVTPKQKTLEKYKAFYYWHFRRSCSSNDLIWYMFQHFVVITSKK